MSISATVLKDSVSPYGHRITTFVVTFNRFILAEFNTHRVLSKNTSSSRAIPVSKVLKQINEEPSMPVWWGAAQRGMSADEQLDDTILVVREDGTSSTDRQYAQKIWLEARDVMVEFAEKLQKVGLHKQLTNRLTENWLTTKMVVTGTEWENFFKLRCHKDAQPEFQELAKKMLIAYNESMPEFVGFGGWHIPFGENIDDEKIISSSTWLEKHGHLQKETLEYGYALLDFKIRIATARAARTSYIAFDGIIDYDADIKLCDKLIENGHMSPTEHCASAMREERFEKNFFGWKQYRSVLEEQREVSV